jgi:hypothetical protein
MAKRVHGGADMKTGTGSNDVDADGIGDVADMFLKGKMLSWKMTWRDISIQPVDGS